MNSAFLCQNCQFWVDEFLRISKTHRRNNQGETSLSRSPLIAGETIFVDVYV